MPVELEFTEQEQQLIDRAREIYQASQAGIHCLLLRKGLDRRTNKPSQKAGNVAFLRRKEDVKG